MSDAHPPQHRTLMPEQAARIDAVCERFRHAYELSHRPQIEQYLVQVPDEERLDLLHELVALEIKLRRRSGDSDEIDDFTNRFPQIDARWLALLITPTPLPGTVDSSAESVASYTHPPRATSSRRIRCPHCHNPINLVDDKSDEVLCPGCGSSFTVRDARHTDTTARSKPLGKYQLLERVGLGAFGAVWKARDTELDRIVALKIPHTGLLTDDAELERFKREARAAAQLRHPGIVTVYDVETLEGLPTIVSDFIAGAPMRDLLQTRRLTFREAASLLADVADAVHYAHTMNVVHRDLKPANILMSFSRERQASADADAASAEFNRITPLIADFGLALRNEAEVTMTMDGHIIGTPAYMSPEQAAGKGHAADARSDVYSLGVILYELLTGELPFRGSRVMMIQQVMHEEPRPPRKVNDKIPRDLETVCLKCMRKEPNRRYQTARELSEDLHRWLKAEPVQARPVGKLERGWRWCRRNPVVASLVALLITSFVGVAWQWYEAEHQKSAAEVATGLAQKHADELGMALARMRAAEAFAVLQSSPREMISQLANEAVLAKQRDWASRGGERSSHQKEHLEEAAKVAGKAAKVSMDPVLQREAHSTEGNIYEELAVTFGGAEYFEKAISAYSSVIDCGGSAGKYLTFRGRCLSLHANSLAKLQQKTQAADQRQKACDDLSVALGGELAKEDKLGARYYLGRTHADGEEYQLAQEELIKCLDEAKVDLKGAFNKLVASALGSLLDVGESLFLKSAGRDLTPEDREPLEIAVTCYAYLNTHIRDFGVDHVKAMEWTSGRVPSKLTGVENLDWIQIFVNGRIRLIGEAYEKDPAVKDVKRALSIYAKGVPEKIEKATVGNVLCLNSRNSVLALKWDQLGKPALDDLINDAKLAIRLLGKHPMIDDRFRSEAHVAASKFYVLRSKTRDGKLAKDDEKNALDHIDQALGLPGLDPPTKDVLRVLKKNIQPSP